MADRRVTLRKRQTYQTRSNKTRLVRIPSGKLVVQSIDKKASGVLCPETKQQLRGTPCVSSKKLKAISLRRKHVTRAYGGCLSHTAVRQRILRAFLIEEARLAKKHSK